MQKLLDKVKKDANFSTVFRTKEYGTATNVKRQRRLSSKVRKTPFFVRHV